MKLTQPASITNAEQGNALQSAAVTPDSLYQ